MAKIILILLVAAILENVGVVCIKGGMNQITGPSEINVSELLRTAKSAVTNGKIMLGMALETAFFGCFLYMLSQKDVSLIWPLTSIGFIVATLAAHFILNEKVSAVRWAGVLLIAAGALLTSYSESMKDQPPPTSESR